MARKTVSLAPTFVGTVYDTETGVYFATRKDGSVTVGRINERGMNVQGGGFAAGLQQVAVASKTVKVKSKIQP